MTPRSWYETVHSWPPIATARWHRCRVISVEKHRKPAGMCVMVEHLGKPHTGRRHEISLELPIFPAGLTNDFLQACGFDLQDGSRIAPKDAVGRTIEGRFAPVDGGEYRATGFRRSKSEE